MIRQARLLFALLPLLFVLTACPYAAEFPLDAPTQALNKSLLGKWTEQSTGENPSFFVISQESDKLYQFEKNDYDTNENTYKKEYMKGYFTPVGKTMFLNLQKKDDANHYFYKVEIAADGKSFTMFEVTDNIDEKFKNSQEMRAFFDKYKDLSFFYNKDEKTYNKQ